jgi:hypothetical protein
MTTDKTNISRWMCDVKQEDKTSGLYLEDKNDI